MRMMRAGWWPHLVRYGLTPAARHASRPKWARPVSPRIQLPPPPHANPRLQHHAIVRDSSSIYQLDYFLLSIM